MNTGFAETDIIGGEMKKRAYFDYEEPYFIDETNSYQMGTLILYRSPKRPRPKQPVYGYKFIQTDKRKKK